MLISIQQSELITHMLLYTFPVQQCLRFWLYFINDSMLEIATKTICDSDKKMKEKIHKLKTSMEFL